MEYDYFDKFTFSCEMYNEECQLVELILNFFPCDNSIQIIDVAKGRNLVRRMHLPPLKLKMLQIGTIVNILNRLIYIKDCAPLTMRTLFSNNESTFALIKPCPPRDLGKIITFILKKGFRIYRLKKTKIDKDMAMKIYKTVAGNPYLPLIINYLTNGEVVGLELVGPNAVKRWKKCLGATVPAEAEPGTLRKTYGKDALQNVAHGSDTLEEATENLDEFFGIENGVPKTSNRATLKNCTCCIVLPHAVIDGNLGLIIEHVITEGFLITAMTMVSVNDTASKEFYEVYKGVVPKFDEMCMHLTQGKSVVFEVKHKDPNVNPVCDFRKVCGPRDPDVCRQLYPETIRGRFGKDLVHNAVHCTDLPEDGEMESEYFFKLLVNEF